MNMAAPHARGRVTGSAAETCLPATGSVYGLDADEFAEAATVAVHDDSRHLGEERVVLAPADVEARFDDRAALPNQDGAAGDVLASVGLHAESLGIAVPAVSGATACFLVCHGM